MKISDQKVHSLRREGEDGLHPVCVFAPSVLSQNPHFTEIVTFEKEVNAKQIANHISQMLVLDNTNKTVTKESITKSFTETIKEAQVDFDLIKIKVFSASGKVLHLTDDQDIGVRVSALQLLHCKGIQCKTLYPLFYFML